MTQKKVSDARRQGVTTEVYKSYCNRSQSICRIVSVYRVLHIQGGGRTHVLQVPANVAGAVPCERLRHTPQGGANVGNAAGGTLMVDQGL